MTNKELTYQYLKTKGFNNAQCAGIMVNIESESNYNPYSIGDGGTSYGICQWHNTRWDRLKNYCSANNREISDLYTQLDFMIYEMQNHYRSVYDDIMKRPDTAENAYTIAYVMCKDFEIPADTIKRSQERGDKAVMIYSSLRSESEVINNSRSIQYKIVQGDTLTKISNQFNVSIQDIAAANNIKNINLINTGDILNIPCNAAPSVSFIEYQVKKGDTLSRIAVNYNTTVGQIATDNNIKNVNLIIVGDILKIRK